MNRGFKYCAKIKIDLSTELGDDWNTNVKEKAVSIMRGECRAGERIIIPCGDQKAPLLFTDTVTIS